MTAAAFDLLVRNGTIVTAHATFTADIGIVGEKIAAIGQLDVEARDVLDATGRYVLPGLIDGHVHFREPGLEYKEDFHTGSRAAVFGGVTTVLDMPNTVPPTSTAERVAHKSALASEKSYCDFGLYGLLDQESVEQLRPMAQAGVVGFKCFLGRSTGDIGPPDDGRLLEALSLIAGLGMRCAFHAENDAILQHNIRKLQAEGRTDPLAHVEARSVIAEVEAIQRAALLASEARAAMHILHLSSREGLDIVQQWRRRGLDITCEVTPQHCFLSSEDMRQLGSLLRINPPVREALQGESLLCALADGRIDAIATDHSPHLPSEKLHDDIWKAVSGFTGVELSLRLFLTYGGLSLQRLVQAMSEAPARIWGLYPRKGAIQVGSDADLTVVDLSVEDIVEAARLHGKNNLTPFEGRRTRGAAMATVLRGQIVMREGELIGPPRGRIVS
jgi:dihydroorotase